MNDEVGVDGVGEGDSRDRITITLQRDVARALKEHAGLLRMSVSGMVNQTLARSFGMIPEEVRKRK